jgi:carbonic anhydrase
VNLGTTVEVPIAGTFAHGGVTYTISQFHFHTPADHSLDGKFEVMEVHFVGASSTGAFSVAGFPIKVGNGTSNELFTNVFANAGKIPNSGDETPTGSLSFAGVAGHLKSNEVFEYDGYLTTPPCTEGVDWVISTTPLTISQEAMVLADSAIGFNARPVQNTNKANVA